ncbi:MAG: Holliday junction resolvase RuvX [Candidatus Dadabacteria bacterium]|nr:Holliday junction resolvase RuvX [Candidatus Dadabacteria bacterium]
MRVLALDVGTKTIGVAVSDELRITANGLVTLRRKTLERDIEELAKIVAEYRPGEIVVGVPYVGDGTVGGRGKEILRFSERVAAELGVSVVHWDESFSTFEAERALIEADVSREKRRKVVDKMAAVVILKEYLESIRDKPGGGTEGK